METTRQEYFKKKNSYLTFATLLMIFRLTTIILLTIVLIYVSIYSVKFAENPSESITKFNEIFSLICRIVLPIMITLWILFKIVVITKKRQLRALKLHIDVVDEI